jgi:hypothetical protein
VIRRVASKLYGRETIALPNDVRRAPAPSAGTAFASPSPSPTSTVPLKPRERVNSASDLPPIRVSAAAPAPATRVERAMTVEEHVDWMISQATSTDNLCRLYEGWAPWI